MKLPIQLSTSSATNVKHSLKSIILYANTLHTRKISMLTTEKKALGHQIFHKC